MAGVALRPLSLGEILDRTFTLYRRHFWLFVGIMAVPQVLALLANVALVLPLGLLSGPTQPSVSESLRYLAVFFLVFPVLAFVYLAVYAVGHGATVSAVSDLHLGRVTSIRQALRKVLPRFWRVFGVTVLVSLIFFATLIVSMFVVLIPITLLPVTGGAGAAASAETAVLMGLAAMVGMLIAAVPGLWIMARASLAVPAVMVEDVSPIAAINRSFSLSRGYSLRLIVVLLLTLALFLAAYMALQLPAQIAAGYYEDSGQPPLWAQAVVLFAGAFSGLLIGPVWAISFALFYFDLRVRKEAFDLQLMMQSLEAGASPESPQPA